MLNIFMYGIVHLLYPLILHQREGCYSAPISVLPMVKGIYKDHFSQWAQLEARDRGVDGGR